ncbi:hypothetical protein GH5_02546 [Leishmania sp. Ghana 2012 LV757]|uniref:hypothetical protein n=1 Tax=Leishmania sp. Ghana 2012 LV757 TaxID=2803181 RepID=UPI001B504A9D|nr:hypothetical protein GH5_02546 [Leishmania sp. Ghana 2012 LV757]
MEIAQTIILSTLCGHPPCMLQFHAVTEAVHVEVWVNNARLYGPENDVPVARGNLRAACVDCGATVAASAAGGPNATYDFLGVHFDHAAHVVSVAADILGGVEPPRLKISTWDLERQHTQLLFCSTTRSVVFSGY